MKKNYSLYGLPKKVEFCSRCTISNQRPRSVVEFKNKDNQKKGIQFGKNQICEACYYSETKTKINSAVVNNSFNSLYILQSNSILTEDWLLKAV
jgi:glucan-binding YG repeat protein